MASIVRELQKDILNSKKSVTEILRTAKVISAKLGLNDITEWINRELNGYPQGPVPEYRKLHGGTLELFDPAGRWIPAGDLHSDFDIHQSITELEELAKGPSIVMTPPKKLPVSSVSGHNYLVQRLRQQIEFPVVQVKSILEAAKEQVLNWTIELEQRGIVGEDMAFDETEKQTATSQTFNIQQFTGVIGNLHHSSVQIYDYSSIHQTLKGLGVAQTERNELENIMDALSKASPAEKPSLIEKAKG